MQTENDNPLPHEYALSVQNQALFQETCPRSLNEQQLFSQWQFACRRWEATNNFLLNLQRENTHLNTIVQQMREEIDSLNEKSSIKDQSKDPLVSNNISSEYEYCTDEDELAKETEWIRVKNRTRTYGSSKPNKSVGTENNDEKKNINQLNTKPPPIIVDNVESYETLYHSLNAIENKFNVKFINDTRAKINCADADSYRKAVDILKTNELGYHSYENKQTRPIRVMAKNLHHTCTTENIEAYLKNKGFKIISVDNKISWKEKKTLNMFVLTFENEDNINKIYGITQILGCKVEIVPVRASNLIPQCKNCQQFGHTKTYCNRQSRCVKCPGKHSTADCKKSDESEPKCVNCGEAHPANYRGCMVAKELQSIKNNRHRKSEHERPQEEEIKKRPILNKIAASRQQRTYADIVTSTSKPQKEANEEGTLQLILKKLTRLEERISGLEKTRKNVT